jgi:hypothetical protein
MSAACVHRCVHGISPKQATGRAAKKRRVSSHVFGRWRRGDRPVEALPQPLRGCYEAGRTGFALSLTARSAGCIEVVAGLKTPRASGARIKSDGKDASCWRACSWPASAQHAPAPSAATGVSSRADDRRRASSRVPAAPPAGGRLCCIAAAVPAARSNICTATDGLDERHLVDYLRVQVLERDRPPRMPTRLCRSCTRRAASSKNQRLHQALLDVHVRSLLDLLEGAGSDSSPRRRIRWRWPHLRSRRVDPAGIPGLPPQSVANDPFAR